MTVNHLQQTRRQTVAFLCLLMAAGQALAAPQAAQTDAVKATISQEQADALLRELRQIRILLEVRLPAAGPPTTSAEAPPAPAPAASAQAPRTTDSQPVAASSESPAAAGNTQPPAQPTPAPPSQPTPAANPAAPVQAPPVAVALAALAGAPATTQPRRRARVGVVIPKLEADLSSTAGAAELLRSVLMAYLSGPVIDAQMISSMLPQQINMEAADKACDHVLYAALGTNKSGGLISGLLGKAAPLVALTPIGAIGTAAGTMAGGKKPGSPLANAGEIAKTLKPKDEVHLEFTLRDVHGGGAPLSSVFSAQAGKAGEDVITPLAAQVADAVLSQVMKHLP